jgi:cell division septum initiation protein DivIVA
METQPNLIDMLRDIRKIYEQMLLENQELKLKVTELETKLSNYDNNIHRTTQ